MSKDKNKILRQITPREYQIYGIFDFNAMKLIYISLDLETVEMEFEIGTYNEDQFDIVKFDVVI